jgi:hypothetical protein
MNRQIATVQNLRDFFEELEVTTSNLDLRLFCGSIVRSLAAEANATTDGFAVESTYSSVRLVMVGMTNLYSIDYMALRGLMDWCSS